MEGLTRSAPGLHRHLKPRSVLKITRFLTLVHTMPRAGRCLSAPMYSSARWEPSVARTRKLPVVSRCRTGYGASYERWSITVRPRRSWCRTIRVLVSHALLDMNRSYSACTNKWRHIIAT